MALDKIDPASPCLRHTGTSFMTAFGINPVLFARSQSALGFIESHENLLTAYDGVIGDMSQWWEKRACRGISPTTWRYSVPVRLSFYGKGTRIGVTGRARKD